MSDPAKAAQGPAEGKDKVPAPASTDQAVIRNFCIIAHIDHGKSTLADRMLQLTGIVDGRQMRAQYLDRMDIERERGITIKSQAVRLPWKKDDTHYVLNMIDTPGHVDFTYEVSPVSLEPPARAPSCWSTPRRASRRRRWPTSTWRINADLKIIPVLNKIDLPAAQPERYADELAAIIGCDPSEVLRVSAKTGEGVEELLNVIVDQVPPPHGDPDAPARALIFDSVYDTYRGVVTYVRVVDGRLTKRERMLMMSTQAVHETLELGVISPEPIPSDGLGGGRGRLRHLRREGRPAGPRRRHDHRLDQSGQGGARRLRPPQADGLLRPLPGRRRRVPGAAGRPRQAQAQRRRPRLRAGDVHRARLRLPLRLPRPAAHGDRQGAARARVRPDR